MKKLLLFSFLFVSFSLSAQINVFSGNNVGIGAGLTSSASTLSVNSAGSSSYAVCVSSTSSYSGGIFCGVQGSNSSPRFGISSSINNLGDGSIKRAIYATAFDATARTDGQAYGVVGIAGNSTNGYNVGILGQLYGSNNGSGVYGQIGTSFVAPDDKYAGYFYGKVKINGTLWVNSTQITSSDDRLKQDVSSIESVDGLYKLKPKKYKYKSINEQVKAITGKLSENANDTTVNKEIVDPDPDMAQKTHFGFLAQDLQQVYPELVYQSADGTLGIDYQGLIPIIIGQMQQMKKSIDDKDEQIKDLKKRVAALEKKKQ
ncbi:MAG TPA: tail fiber domain-containing protein [Bacteroidales bacterium]|nr:tail fiber domain-containing protein [Bacteroidales bacterium]